MVNKSDEDQIKEVLQNFDSLASIIQDEAQKQQESIKNAQEDLKSVQISAVTKKAKSLL